MYKFRIVNSDWSPSTAVNSGSLMDVTKEDLEEFLESLEQNIKIVDATVTMRPEFKDIVTDQDNLRLVYLQTWAGLGAVRFVSIGWSLGMDIEGRSTFKHWTYFIFSSSRDFVRFIGN